VIGTNRCSRLLMGVAALLLLTSGAATAIDVGDPTAGEKKAKACNACHGPKAQNPSWPMIMGQHPDYLLHSLKAYKSGERQNAVMNGQAAQLSLEDMQDLAAYYGSLDSKLGVLDGE